MRPEKLQKGEMYKNLTYKWLRPILSHALPEYIKKYMIRAEYNIKVLGYFRSDVQYFDATEDNNKDLIFVVYDVKGKYFSNAKKYKSISLGKQHFNEMLEEIRKSRYGYCDYPVRLNNKDMHVVVFQLEGWGEGMERFDKGEFSTIYQKQDLRRLKFESPQEIYWIVNKTEEAKELFAKKIQAKFNTNVMPETTEYEISPLKAEEWLNEEKSQT